MRGACICGLFMLCLIASCVDKKLIVKTIPVRPGLSLVWYRYSLITSMGPDYVEFEDSVAGKEELIFEAQLICQIQARSDSIEIFMQGNSIIEQAQKNAYHYKIAVDTTCRSPYLYK